MPTPNDAQVPRACDAVVIGAGPGGASAARLLRTWGHSVVVLSTPAPPARGLAESIPPSARKLLATIGTLDRIDSAGFCRSTGNTVWWGDSVPRIEWFAAGPEVPGYQVFRPAFDRMLLDAAVEAGVIVANDAAVRRVTFHGNDRAEVEYRRGASGARRIECRFVLDCSGRAGVIARRGLRRSQPAYRTHALVGVWHAPDRWVVPDESHTLVETYDDGWAWSIPTTAKERHVTVMFDPERTLVTHGRGREARYRGELAKARNLSALVRHATLKRVWGCDASLYAAHAYAGAQFILVGDAGTFIDPISSFGVKKALASAWVGAIAVHTCLTTASMQPVALEFFEGWERQVYEGHLRRLVEYGRSAADRHSHPFWQARAALPLERASSTSPDEVLLQDAQVTAACEALKRRPAIALAPSPSMRFLTQGSISGNEIVPARAVASDGLPGGRRFMKGVDLPAVVDMASAYSQVPDLYDAYCRQQRAVPLSSFLAALALLLGKRALVNR